MCSSDLTEVLKVACLPNGVIVQSITPFKAPVIETMTLVMQGATSAITLQVNGIPA